jgi:effector-binding domain-containing protein
MENYRMISIRRFRFAVLALVPVAAISLGLAVAKAQPAPAASTPAAAPGPAPAATPAPPPAETKSPADTPAAEQAPASPPPAAPIQAADPFGEEIVLPAKKVVIVKGSASWDAAFDTLIESFKSLTAFLDKQNIARTGNPMIVYTSTDDTGFTFLAELPVDQEPKNLGKDMSIGQSPEGKALKFVHRGSYDNMDNTYEAITNHLDDKKLEAKDTFIEEYITDPLKTEEDKLVINVYVPLK